MTVNVRIAPSPTGLLHIGNIRAALFNFLFARKCGGKFMLRLDDTDRIRSTDAFADAIKKDLSWLGLEWDVFARQSDRLDVYKQALERLIKTGHVYPCYETQAELDLKRKTQLGRGLPPIYDRSALRLTQADRQSLESNGRKPHWRFKLDPVDVVWDDLVQGHKTLPGGTISDPVLVREDGVPLYTFCSVVDDIDDGTTHIIRGEDHVTNTAVQIQIWNALTTSAAPVFAHFPLIVSASGIEMSKRLGTLSIASMRDDMQIEPMAINALLAKLGTSDPVVPRYSLAELVQDFDLSKISHATPKFDLEDLKALNAKILHQTPFDVVRERFQGVDAIGLDEGIWNAVRSNITCIGDVYSWNRIIHGEIAPVIVDDGYTKMAADLLPSGQWDEHTWHLWTEELKIKTGRKGKDLFMPLRLALTTFDHGPEMKNLLPLIGFDKAKMRLTGTSA